MRLIRDGQRGEGKGGGGGVEGEIIYLSLHCHHQNDSCIKMGSDESHFNVSLVRLHSIRQCPIICIPQYNIRQFFSAQNSSVPHYLHSSIQYLSFPLHSIRQCPIIYIPQYSICLFHYTAFVSAPLSTSLNTVSVCFSAQYSSVPLYLHPSIQYPSVSLHSIRQCPIIYIPQYSIRLFLCTVFVSAPLSTSLNTVSVCFSAQYSSVPHYLHPSIQYPSVSLHSIRQCPIIYIPQYSICLFHCTVFVSAPLSAFLNTVSVCFSAQYSSVPHYLHPSIQYLSVPLHSIRQCPFIYIPQYSICLFLCTVFVSAPLSTSLNTVSVCSTAQYSSVPHYLHHSIQYPSVFSSSSVYPLDLYKLSSDAPTLSACQFSSQNNYYYSVG